MVSRAFLHRLAGRLPDGLRRALKRLPGVVSARDRLYERPSGPVPKPGQLRPVIYLPTWLEWEVMRQRPHYILDAFAAGGHPVFFVDPRLSETKQRNGVLLTPSLRATPGSEVIIYTHFAPNRTLFEHYRDSTVVYDILDDLSIYDPDELGFPEHRRVRYHHAALVEEAGVVMASNQILLERHRGERADILLVENGVDPDLFRPGGPAVEHGEGAVVGYHGAIAPWLDFELIRQVIDSRPWLRFVFVGPVERGAEVAAESLRGYENVSFVPRQIAVDTARHVRGFTVGWIPFQVTEMTRGVTPLKMYELMASGVPVVATPLPACVSHPLVGVGETAAEVAAIIDESLGSDEGDRRSLRLAGEEAAWGRRIEPLLERLHQLGLRQVSPA